MLMQFIKPANAVPLNKLPVDFNWKTYIELNDDVRSIYPSEEAATQHYMYEGYRQQRRYSLQHVPTDFHWMVYLALNQDVYRVCKTKISTILHYEFHGYNESRLYSSKHADFPSDFDWVVYQTLNPTLISSIQSELDAIVHYITIGKSQQLPYQYTYKHVPPDFNWKIYRELNSDVKDSCLTEFQAKLHYDTDGYVNGRQYDVSADSIPADFDWKIYIELNPDITSEYNSEPLSRLHYYISGKTDERLYKLKDTPTDFDWKMYIELNNSMPEKYKSTELMCKLHYELYGKEQNLPYQAVFEFVPADFNWKEYVRLNPDISEICTSEIRSKQHYDKFGVYQDRKYIQTLTDDAANILQMNEYNKFPYLFHKYLLGISSPITEMKYTEIDNTSVKLNTYHSMVAHLHCYNIDKFQQYYSNYMNVIQSHCSIAVVTFCVGNEQNLPVYENMVFIRTSNIGMDIGGKFVCVNYLKKYNVDYKHILFLHSKQDDAMRKAYWEPLLLNMAQIIRSIQNDDNIGIFVPPLIFMGDYANIIYKDHFIDPNNVTCKWNMGNEYYMKDLDGYCEFQSKNFLFPEGNCFISNKAIADMLYGDASKYNLLNTNVSFDAVWVKSYYGGRMLKDVGQNIREIFRFFRSHRSRERIYPNNLAWGAGHKGHADNMYEHSYERIVFKVVQKLGYTVKIMPWLKTSEYIATLERYNQLVNQILKSGD